MMKYSEKKQGLFESSNISRPQEMAINASAKLSLWDYKYKANIVFKLLCLMFILVALIVLLVPENWLMYPGVKEAVDDMVAKIPRIAYLAHLSDSPRVVMAGYCIVYATAPFYAILTALIMILPYISGYVAPLSRKTASKGILCSWPFIIMVWMMFISCLYCDGNPGRHDRILSSGRLVIATFVQGIIVFTMFIPGAHILVYLYWRDNNWARVPAEEKRNGN